MKSKARRHIDKWVKTHVKTPVYLAEGRVFLWPSDTEAHHLVTWMERQTPKNVFEEFACSCKGFFYNEGDECKHIKELKIQLGRGK